jgi:ubiquinone/menaquinone biosynthesis C-methylase UbiE
MAKTYSLTTVTGIDCDQLFPSHVPVPNANFNICNIVNGLPFDDNTFDFVHQRFLGTTFTEKEWTEVIPELVRVTKPGGWIELMEMDIQGQNEGMSAQQFTSGCEYVKEF